MSNAKISALTSASTPLAGTEVLPLVQTTTKKVSVANLTAGRSVSAADFTASTGNFIVGTAGKGVDFSATAGTGTSELLADYEEGTWTVSAVPSTSGSITLYSAYSIGSYTKIGRMVTVSGFIYAQSVSSPVGSLEVRGLPYAIVGGDPIGRGAGSVSGTGLTVAATTSLALRYFSGDTRLYIDKFTAGSLFALAGNIQAFTEIWFTATYPTTS